jgi:hypothetical protein
MTEARVLQALPNSAAAQTSIAVRPGFQPNPVFPETISDREDKVAARPQEGKKSVGVRLGSGLHSMLIG